jgi:HSP20 family protein
MLFSDAFLPLTSMARTAYLPPVDVTVSEGDLVLAFDVPGLTADDLSIELHGGELIVRGERRRPQVADGTQWAHAERGFGKFERRIRVPEGVDPDAMTASLDNGVLSLIVPKPERLKPRSITIGTGEGQRELETTTA